MTATCSTCSAPLSGRRRTRRYCSNACRQRGYRNRDAATTTVTVEASPIEPPAAESPTCPWGAWTDYWGNGDDEW